MKDKFTMPLTWHNCYDCPPEEHYNDRLWATDGTWVFSVTYQYAYGWYDKEAGEYLPGGLLWKYYWADPEQTVRGCSEFKEE
jgi:hypothetical protein